MAGLLAFGVAALFGEPQLELAIGFETAMTRAAGHAMEPHLFDCGMKPGLAPLGACIAVGVALGGVLALALAFAWRNSKATGGLKASTIGRHAAAIGYKLAGFEWLPLTALASI